MTEPIALGHYHNYQPKPADVLYLGPPDQAEQVLGAVSRQSTPEFLIDSIHEFSNFTGHAILVGQSGSGKSTTLGRIIREVTAKWEWQVIVIDAKPDDTLRKTLMKICKDHSKRLVEFPGSGFDIWAGDSEDVAIRLVELFHVFEEHRLLAIEVLREAIESAQVQRVDPGAEAAQLLKGLLKSTEEGPSSISKDVARKLADQWAAIVRVFSPIFFAKGQGLVDGDLVYFGIDALRFPGISLGLASLVLRDIASYVMSRPDKRKKRMERKLLVFDEFSAVPASVATDLVERIRSYDVQVLLAVQSYSGLGPHNERLLDACNMLLLHRCARPQRLLKYGATGVDAGLVARLGYRELLAVSQGRAALLKVKES